MHCRIGLSRRLFRGCISGARRSGEKSENEDACGFRCVRSEILAEERHQLEDTMRRENRRVQAMSWGKLRHAQPPSAIVFPLRLELPPT